MAERNIVVQLALSTVHMYMYIIIMLKVNIVCCEQMPVTHNVITTYMYVTASAVTLISNLGIHIV